MKPLGALMLLLLSLTHGRTQTQPATEKPTQAETQTQTHRGTEEGGECPAESRLGPICQMKLGERCSHHDDCEIWQSCCDAGCGKRCVMDLKTGGQEGTCPHSSRLHYVCKMNFTAPCDGDHSCGHWSSCCHTQCGPRCVPECMSTVLPKKCPEISKVSILCKRNFSQACEEDDDCSFQKQCCDIGCGKKCVYAFTQGENVSKRRPTVPN
ncbi:WAP four-disulfide core domain protein 3-like [Carcharodon carcharias]|uniref:WAP four-disulfide core domain protein 3-like n=1 Tax=Carcharodon carcharias TaxID=13397 RepID=UPI001B7E8394|nr:WAP four-disulfide core domain protein 3-like [Carcharodon carcharias]